MINRIMLAKKDERLNIAVPAEMKGWITDYAKDKGVDFADGARLVIATFFVDCLRKSQDESKSSQGGE